jgi:hypothetical protein
MIEINRRLYMGAGGNRRERFRLIRSDEQTPIGLLRNGGKA